MNTIAKMPPLSCWTRWLASGVLLAFVSVRSVQAQGTVNFTLNRSDYKHGR